LLYLYLCPDTGLNNPGGPARPTTINLRIEPPSDTVVYDALDTARKMLMDYRSDLPQLRKRIIIVSDGADTGSKASARDVCHALQMNNVIVDSVQVGNVPDNVLIYSRGM
jgi:hypothetical protein